jgi:hypothetical protein
MVKSTPKDHKNITNAFKIYQMVFKNRKHRKIYQIAEKYTQRPKNLPKVSTPKLSKNIKIWIFGIQIYIIWQPWIGPIVFRESGQIAFSSFSVLTVCNRGTDLIKQLIKREKIYQMDTKYTKWTQNIPNGHKKI